MRYALNLPEGQFGTVLADPPWALLTGGVRRAVHYDRMTTEEIAAMPVANLVTPDAHLWLWTTNSHLPEALTVVEAWGFTYRSLLTWAKPNMATGWWLRGKTEHVIFASRSKRLRANPGNVTTLLQAPTRGHSVKPLELIPLIERLSPGPYLELFARAERVGWTTQMIHLEPENEHGDRRTA
jgi:N6-adenosine-specific RNA methylase IME4